MTRTKLDAAAATWEAIDSLTPWAQNPRNNDEAVEQVAASIRRFGFASPIIARAADRSVIAGHTRLKAAQQLGLDLVPVRFVELDEDEARALALADNKLNEIATWDEAGLSEVLRELEQTGLDLSGLGWQSDDLDALLSEMESTPQAPTTAPTDALPDAPPAITKAGEIFTLGRHRVICGDCRDPATWARLFSDGERINVAFTSPPYASQRTYDESSGFKPIRPDEYVAWFEAVQENVRAHLTSDGSWFVNIRPHSENGQRSLYVTDLVLAHARRWGWRFVDEFCWLRIGVPGSPEQMGRFKNAWESVFWFSLNKPKFRPANVSHESDAALEYSDQSKGLQFNNLQGELNQPARVTKPGIAYPSNVLDLKGMARSIGHPAAFPAALPTFFVKAYSDPGDIICDPFLGSGTTLIAAEQEGRTCYGFEMSPEYCDIIRARYDAHRSQS